MLLPVAGSVFAALCFFSTAVLADLGSPMWHSASVAARINRSPAVTGRSRPHVASGAQRHGKLVRRAEEDLRDSPFGPFTEGQRDYARLYTEWGTKFGRCVCLSFGEIPPSGSYEADIPVITYAFKVAFGVSNDNPLVTSRTLSYCKEVARADVQRRYAAPKSGTADGPTPRLTDKLDGTTLQMAQYHFRFHWALQRCLCYNEWLNADFDANMPAIDATCRGEARLAALLAGPSSSKDFTRLRAMPLPRRVAVRWRQAQNLARALGRRLGLPLRGGAGGVGGDSGGDDSTRKMSAAAADTQTVAGVLPPAEPKQRPASRPRSLWSTLWAPGSWTAWRRGSAQRKGGSGVRKTVSESALGAGYSPGRMPLPGARRFAP